MLRSGDSIPSENFCILDSELLRAGDVLLTRGVGREAVAIAMGTGGPFSHAAIWLPRVGNTLNAQRIAYLELFESEDLGLGATPLQRVEVLVTNGSRKIGLLIPNITAASIYRHPGIQYLDDTTLEHAANRLRSKEEHLGYSELDRLALAAKTLGLRSFLENYLRSKDKRDVYLVPGSFCSELVAKYFQEVKLGLFWPEKRPENVSPNDLSRSFLEHTDGIIIHDEEVVEITNVERLLLSRKDIPGMVRFNSGYIKSNQLAAELEQKFIEQRAKTIRNQRSLVSWQLREALDYIKKG
jgi:hypothetical protein